MKLPVTPVRIIRGVINSFSAVAGAMARCSVSGLSGETIDDRESFGPAYGFTSRPRPGAECLIIRRGSEFLIIASDDRRYRLALQNGDAVLYSSTTDYVKCKGDGGIEVNSSGTVIVEAPAIQLGGNEGIEALIDSRFVALFNNHTHLAPGGSTDTPLIQADSPLTPCLTTITKAK